MAGGSINAHWAFYQAPKKNDFWNATAVDDSDAKALRAAREKIRAQLRSGLGDWEKFTTKQQLFEREFVRKALASPRLRPKFKMQGSFVYATVNDPAQKPPQQVDMDDGVYMPTGFIRIQGNDRPILASRGYFAAAEAILEPLCEREGWRLDKTKSSCVRVVISDRAHIDLPLYAIPDDQFARMTETLAKTMGFDARADAEELIEAQYRALPADQLMLAHRDNGWEQSDPRKIEDWFQQAVETHDEVLRRLSRYFKAWRDFHWQKPKLSSLAIMACIVDILDGLNVDLPNARDDVAILLVSERMADRLNRPILNPVMTDDAELALDRDWTAADRAEFVTKAGELHQRLTDALHGTDNAAVVLTRLTSAFGDRVTDDVSVIRVERREVEVKSFPKAAVAAPLVRRTTSG